MKLQEGQQAPDFVGVDQDNIKHNLAKYEGEWILLYFYPRDNTPGCTKEACSFRDLFIELKEKVIILGISSDSIQSHKKFTQKHNLPFPLISDEDKVVINKYGADGAIYPKRVSFLINPEGVIKKIYDKLSPETHAEEVLDDIHLLSSPRED